VHTHGLTGILYAGPIYAFGSLPPVVHTFHFGNYPHLKKKYLIGEMVCAKFINQLISVSDVQRENLIKYLHINPAKIKTIWNGVSPSLEQSQQTISNKRAEFGYHSDDIVIGCVAVLTKQKGVENFLEAISLIKNQFKNAKFLIVGGGPLQQELQEKAKNLNIANKVHFAGWRSDAREILPILDIYVMPSLWEAFSVALLEAMAAKLPIIVTDIAEHSKLIKHKVRGLLIPPRDPKALADAIATLVNNREMRKGFAQSSYQFFLQNLTIEKMIEKHEQLYAELANRNIRKNERTK
jgi:glycosyltransferase involved in cell wall biosynthesis